MNTATRKLWYSARSSGQGLVVEEGTGRNVAVTYETADAPLVAAAPELLQALQDLEAYIEWWSETHNDGALVNSEYMVKARKVIAKANMP